MPFNKSELVLDRVRSLTFHEYETNKVVFRLTNIEDPSLQCTAENEEVTDAIGSVITTLYRAKRATFSGTNSLISLDLAAAQYGTEKVVGTSAKKITVPTYEVLTIAEGAVTLTETPVGDVAYIYSLVDGGIGTAYAAGVTASATEFAISGKEITVPTALTGKVYVEYNYETENAVKVVNSASKFPKIGSLLIYAYFRDKCDENTVYSGRVIAPRAKPNPEQIELALTSTGKHPFEFLISKDPCAEDDGQDELFAIVVAE